MHRRPCVLPSRSSLSPRQATRPNPLVRVCRAEAYTVPRSYRHRTESPSLTLSQPTLPVVALRLPSPPLRRARRRHGERESWRCSDGWQLRERAGGSAHCCVASPSSLSHSSLLSSSRRAACVCQRAQRPLRPLAPPYPLTRPPITAPLERRQCGCMEARHLLPQASQTHSLLPLRDPHRVTPTHAPRPLCHAFDCPTVGVHAYKVAVRGFLFPSHARTTNGARLTVRR